MWHHPNPVPLLPLCSLQTGRRTSAKSSASHPLRKGRTRRIYAELPKGRGYVLRISCERFRGQLRVDIRTWFEYTPGNPDTRQPSKSGVSMSAERLPELIAALQAAEQDLTERGLLGRPT